ncbi:MAG: Holliday junction resolvase RuvX [Proteobacteria bacterium]|nr:Holliday junction resolvase RuvX [Pseudomonadota bacterium]
MALDYGEARIGVAVSDPTGVFARPLETIAARGRGAAPVNRIATLVREYDVGRIVVGLPLRFDGSSGSQAERSRAFGARVARRTGLPVDFFDERWSSEQARRALRDTGVPARKQKGRVDPIAASLILQAWMDREAM